MKLYKFKRKLEFDLIDVRSWKELKQLLKKTIKEIKIEVE